MRHAESARKYFDESRDLITPTFGSIALEGELERLADGEIWQMHIVFWNVDNRASVVFRDVPRGKPRIVKCAVDVQE